MVNGFTNNIIPISNIENSNQYTKIKYYNSINNEYVIKSTNNYNQQTRYYSYKRKL